MDAGEDVAARQARGRHVLFFLALMLTVAMLLNDDARLKLDDDVAPSTRVQDPRVVRS